MARIKKQNQNKEEKQERINTCNICGKPKKVNQFYKSNKKEFQLNGGVLPYCKNCLKDMCINENKIFDINKFKDTLKLIDKPFIQKLYDSALRDKRDTLGAYMSLSNMNDNAELTWKDSDDFKKNNNINNVEAEKEKIIIKDKEDDNYNIDKLKEKYGHGYPDEEYILFEKKYQQLRPSVKVLTTMHDEFFREYCVDKVKETLAKAKGDFKEAKEWASMAKDASTAGKLNPNQMSKADLSGGMDTFGQMSRMVEETPKGELLKILPKFIEKPKDKVDVVLWLYVNYVRDLKGLSECDYKEIYNFYEERKDSYEQQMLDHELSNVKDGEIDG